MIHRIPGSVRPALGLDSWCRYRPSPPASAFTSILASRWSPRYRRKSPTASSESVSPNTHCAPKSLAHRSLSVSRHSPLLPRLPSLCLQPAAGKPPQLPRHSYWCLRRLIPQTKSVIHGPPLYPKGVPASHHSPPPPLPHPSLSPVAPSADRHFTLDLHHRPHNHLNSPGISFISSYAPAFDHKSPVTSPLHLPPFPPTHEAALC